MDDLRRAFLEEPIWLYVMLAVVEAVLAAAWHYRRSRRLAWALLAPPALAVAVGVLAWAVTTERERLAQALDQLAVAVRRGDHATVVKLVDRDYQDGRFDYDGILGAAGRTMDQYKLRAVSVSGLKVQIEDGQATVKFSARIEGDFGFGADEVHTAWTLWWVQRPEGWRIISARLDMPPGIEGAPVGLS